MENDLAIGGKVVFQAWKVLSTLGDLPAFSTCVRLVAEYLEEHGKHPSLESQRCLSSMLFCKSLISSFS